MSEVITPGQIARGQGDGYLVRMNRKLVNWGEPTYIRPLAEMNQANNAYAGFNKNGTSRGASHSPKAFKAAWRRMTLILRGGPVADIDAKLAALHLPPVRGVRRDGVLGTPQVALMWVPQTRGTPDIPANMPRAYWPGPGYVDWVGTDFYSRFPRFDWLTQFYNSFKGKPFVFGEWGMWGSDNPGFVRQLFAWVRARPRVKLMMYNQGKLHRGPFRLDNYPQAKAEIKRQLARRR
jgi:beta-mannanase